MSCSADKIDLDSSSCDAVTFTQTLEYIDDVDPEIRESTRLSKSGSKFVNVSTLWDYFGFHGPEKSLNAKMHDVIRGQKHPMLPTQLNGILEKFGYKNIRTKDISFYITTRDEYSFPKFHELNMVRAELQNGISEDEVKKWQDQLNQAEQDGTFAFTSFAILTSAYWL